MNKVVLIGRISNDLKLNVIGEKKTSTIQFSLAVNRNYKNKDGKYDTDFINCVAFGNIADFINKYFKKGDELAVEGRVQTRTYEKDGNKKYITEIMAEHVEFTYGSKSNDNQINKTEEINDIPSNYKTDYEESSNEFALDDKDLPW
ncbi:MAG: single-stranded DNA-binding protein [Bacilli bacterium]|nr:single-stranded DNA-binding protein [Bacilli bacterium]